MAYTTTAHQLFEDTLPGFIAATDVAIQGPVLFDIGGRDGGSWVVDFRQRTVTTGGAAGPMKVIVRAEAGDFIALVEGRMSPDDGVLTKRLHVAGDAAAIAHLMGALAQLRGHGRG